MLCHIILVSHNFSVLHTNYIYRSVQIPIDPYWAAAMLSTFRAMLCIVAPNVTSRFKRRPIYLACCAIVCMGTLTLSSYCYFNQNNQLVNQFPVTRWIPILAIVICYTGFSFGYGSVVYILQVNSKNIFSTITPLIKLCTI